MSTRRQRLRSFERPTFETLNHNPLRDYSKATSDMEVEEIEKAYFPQLQTG